MDSIILYRQKSYDLPLRLIHALNAVSVILLLITGFGHDLLEHGASADALWHIHIFSGYFLIWGLGARIIWGFVGPKHARWRDFFVSIRTMLAFISNRKIMPHIDFGHPPLATFAYVIFYASAIFSGISGIMLAASEHGIGPMASFFSDDPAVSQLLEEPHEIFAFAIGAFIILHLAAMAVLEKKEKRPIAQAMLSGYQYLHMKNSPPLTRKDNNHED